MHDWPCAQAAVDARLRVAPDDTEALELRANNFEYLNQIEKARAIYKDLLDRGKGGSSDLNDFSWDALALGKVEETDIQAAQQAAAMSQNTEYNTLQTLASLYAEVGKTKEARDIVLHTLDVTGLEEPDAALWYVLARIDEQYGETTAALEAYHRINMEDFGDNPSPSSTSALIKKRLAGLANHGAPQSAAR